MINAPTNPKKRRSPVGWFRIVITGLFLAFYTSPDLFAPEPWRLLSGIPSNELTTPEVKILSWNIAMLPVVDLVRSGNDRAKCIGEALQKKDYDIIVFQEAFSKKARRAIYRELRKFYPFTYGPAHTGPAIKINSGLWVLSRIPLRLVREYKFSDCQGFDCLSKKGAILLEGRCHNQSFQVIGTHLDSDENDESIRMLQLHELYDSIINPYSNPEVPQIICGDFNTDRDLSEQYLKMLNILNCNDGNLAGEERITFGFPTNPENLMSNEKPRQLDYIFTKNLSVISQIFRRVARIPETHSSSEACLSDHYGIEATINFIITDSDSRSL